MVASRVTGQTRTGTPEMQWGPKTLHAPEEIVSGLNRRKRKRTWLIL